MCLFLIDLHMMCDNVSPSHQSDLFCLCLTGSMVEVCHVSVPDLSACVTMFLHHARVIFWSVSRRGAVAGLCHLPVPDLHVYDSGHPANQCNNGQHIYPLC